jgi:SOS-response transcriptional repressor LexA
MLITDADMSAIGKVIKARRIAKGLSARQLAEKVGVSDAHIIYIEKAQRKATFDKLMNILGALGIPVDELLSVIGREGHGAEGATGLPLRRIPVVSWVKAGSWREICDSFEPGDADEWIETDVPGENVFALKVSGDSMETEFLDGETIIVNPHMEAQPGDFIVVKNPEGEATFKQLKKYGDRWVLHPLNPRHPDIEVNRGEFRIIGKVVKKEKKY